MMFIFIYAVSMFACWVAAYQFFKERISGSAVLAALLTMVSFVPIGNTTVAVLYVLIEFFEYLQEKEE